MFRMLARLSAVLLLLLAHPGFTASAQETRPVTIFAAASLQSALSAVAAEWRRETGKQAAFSYAASSALARQIEQGAPADLFISADLDWMDWLQERSLVKPDSRRTLLGNSLVLIAARDWAGDLTIGPGFGLAAALGEARLALANPQAVPAGRYARQALSALGVWGPVERRVAGTDNVRAALALVARGEARFGIVYDTDARTEPRVRVVGRFPAESHAPILYPVALTASSRHPDASAFLAYLAGPAATRIFEAEGFTIRR